MSNGLIKFNCLCPINMKRIKLFLYICTKLAHLRLGSRLKESNTGWNYISVDLIDAPLYIKCVFKIYLWMGTCAQMQCITCAMGTCATKKRRAHHTCNALHWALVPPLRNIFKINSFNFQPLSPLFIQDRPWYPFPIWAEDLGFPNPFWFIYKQW